MLVVWRKIGSVLVIALGVLTCAASSSAALILHPKWSTIATHGDRLADDDGQYQLWVSVKHPLQATLISDRTGKRAVLSRAGCSPDLLSLPWVLFDCGLASGKPVAQLYAPSAGTWTAVNLAPSIAALCPAASSQGPHGVVCFITPESIGSDWIEFYIEPLTSTVPAPGVTYAYQNLKSGQVVENGAQVPDSGAPATATTSIDLNSPSLTSTVCPPLSNPQEVNATNGQAFYSSLFFFGPFAITGMTLERCGSQGGTPLNLPSGVSIYESSKIIVWQATPRTLHAILLPSLRQSTFSTPAVVNTASALTPLVLGPARLYIQDRSRVWSTPIPGVRSHK